MQVNKNLTFKHYKEPLKAIPEGTGFGYYGAVLQSKDLSNIQCHECGELHRSLVGHVKSHGLNPKEYKKKYELSPTTALVSEQLRWQYKEKTLEWINSMSEEERTAYRAELKNRSYRANKKRRPGQPKESLENKNKKGTCPDQILDQIKKVAKKLGKTPSKHEFIGEMESQRFVHLIYKTFGSWKKALEMAKLTPVKQKQGQYRKYDDETLLEYLRIFAQENNRIPTATDFRRGLLPDYGVYVRHFGGIQKARDAAGLEEFIETDIA